MTKSLLIYRQRYALLSETFISDHIRSLRRYAPIVATEHQSQAGHRPDVPVTEVGGSRLGRALFMRFGVSPSFSRLLKRADVALVHVHFLIDAVRLLPAMERSKLPLVVTAHGYDATLNDAALAESEDGRLLLERREWLKRRATLIVCVSEFIRDELARKGYPEDKLVVLPLGVDVETLTPRSSEGHYRGIVTVGRLVEKKGMHKLIEAYALLPEDLRTQHPLTIVGDGPLRQSLVSQANGAGIEVEFAGALPRTATLARISAAAAFCLPSIRARNGDAEGMPISIMEALALGAPVAIFDDQPMAPLLRAANAGTTATAADAGALAATLKSILTDKAYADAVSTRGREFCVDHFSLVRNTGRLEMIYDDVVESR